MTIHILFVINDTNLFETKEMKLAPGMPQYQHPGEPSLYVMESVELELSLTDLSSDLENSDLRSDSFTCPIKLMKGQC